MKTDEWIREGRNRIGYTKQELADMLPCSVATLNAWEGGKREPSLKYMDALLFLFGVPDELERHGVKYSKHAVPGTDRFLLGIDRSGVAGEE